VETLFKIAWNTQLLHDCQWWFADDSMAHQTWRSRNHALGAALDFSTVHQIEFHISPTEGNRSEWIGEGYGAADEFSRKTGN
jgi:hypothetical protein